MKKILLGIAISLIIILSGMTNTVIIKASEISTLNNNPPYIPHNPQPANNSINIQINNLELSWYSSDPDGDEITYDLYLNVCPQPDASILYTNPNEEPYARGLDDRFYDQVWLVPGQTYYWKIVAIDEHGAKTEGPIWTFETILSDELDPVDNIPPNRPIQPTIFPDDTFYVGSKVFFTTNVVDPDEDNINIYWDMDEDDIVDYESLDVKSGEPCMITYKWDKPPGLYFVRVIAADLFFENSQWSEPLMVNVLPSVDNNPPNNASIPAGISSGYAGKSYTFKTFAVDPDQDKIKYRWDFGDGTVTGWVDNIWVESGTTGSYSHIWDEPGYYNVKAQVMDINGVKAPWSESKLVNIIEKKTATIYNMKDFCGTTHGDSFDILNGQGRIAYSNGSTGKFVTGAYAGFPFGYSWSQALQGVGFYIGRQKTLKIDTEISYISGTHFVPPAFTWLENVIKIDGLYEPKKEFKKIINTFGEVEDLIGFSNSILLIGKVDVMALYDMYKLVNGINIFAAKKTAMHYASADYMTNGLYWNYQGKNAAQHYRFLWQLEYGYSGGMQTAKQAAKQATTSTVVKSSTAASPPTAIGPLWLVLTVAWEIMTLIQLMTHWQVDTLLTMFEHDGKAQTDHFSKSYTFEKGSHDVWAGMQTSAEGFAFFFGFAYAAGLVKSITIDGIAPPEKPHITMPEKIYKDQTHDYTITGLDQNDDPIKFIIDWGDDSDPITTDEINSGQSLTLSHKYTEEGWFRITITAEDCDKMKSEEQEYIFWVDNQEDDDDEVELRITEPKNHVYINNEQLTIIEVLPLPLILGRKDIIAQKIDNNQNLDNVVFKIDNEERKTDSDEPYKWMWDNPQDRGLIEIQTDGKKNGNTVGTDDKIVLYSNSGSQTITTTQTDNNQDAEGQKEYEIHIKSDLTEQQIISNIDQTITDINQYFNNTNLGPGDSEQPNTIKYKYEIDYENDGTIDKTLIQDYPILKITHSYQDNRKHTIKVLITTQLTLNGETYEQTETLTTQIGDSSGEKPTFLNLLQRLFSPNSILSKIFHRFPILDRLLNQ